jgi:hypothetical protein
VADKQAGIQWFVFFAANAMRANRNKLDIREMNDPCESAAFTCIKIHWKSVAKSTIHTGNYRPNFLGFKPHSEQSSVYG